MSELIIICLVLIMFAICILICGLVANKQEVIGCGLIAILLIGFFGFGFFGTAIGVSSEESLIIPNEIAKAKYTVFVRVDGKDLTSTDARFVNSLEESIRVKKIQYYNSYGKKLHANYELVEQ